MLIGHLINLSSMTMEVAKCLSFEEIQRSRCQYILPDFPSLIGLGRSFIGSNYKFLKDRVSTSYICVFSIALPELLSMPNDVY